jgi:hypothetical protein
MLIMSNIREYEMKFKFLKTTFFGLVLSVSGFANAGLITDLSEKDWLAVGDSLITYDSSTGLEWLDLSVTRGNSILQTEQESFYGSFRWATSTEIEALFDNVIGGVGFRSSANLDDVALGNEFLNLFSRSTNNFAQGVSRGSPVPTLGYGLGYVSTRTSSVTVNDPGSNCCWDETINRLNVGSWLVRRADIPEPSTLAIFAFGMIGLASRRFKKQS